MIAILDGNFPPIGKNMGAYLMRPLSLGKNVFSMH
jgi:hypothetical protein